MGRGIVDQNGVPVAPSLSPQDQIKQDLIKQGFTPLFNDPNRQVGALGALNNQLLISGLNKLTENQNKWTRIDANFKSMGSAILTCVKNPIQGVAEYLFAFGQNIFTKFDTLTVGERTVLEGYGFFFKRQDFGGVGGSSAVAPGTINNIRPVIVPVKYGTDQLGQKFVIPVDANAAVLPDLTKNRTKNPINTVQNAEGKNPPVNPLRKPKNADGVIPPLNGTGPFLPPAIPRVTPPVVVSPTVKPEVLNPPVVVPDILNPLVTPPVSVVIIKDIPTGSVPSGSVPVVAASPAGGGSALAVLAGLFFMFK